MKTSFFDIENWREIGSTLARNKTRTLLTAFGIFWGTAMLAMLLGGAGGLKGMLMRQLNGLATNMGAVWTNRTSLPYKGFPKGRQWDLTVSDIETIRRITPHMESSSCILSNIANISYGSRSLTSTGVTGVDGGYDGIQLPVMHEGRFLNESDIAKRRKVAVIGKNVAGSLFGTEEAVGRFIGVNGIYFKIIGVASQMSEVSFGQKIEDSVTIPSSTFRQVFNWNDKAGIFLFTAEPGHTPTELGPYISRAIRAGHPIHPNDDLAIGIEDLAEQMKNIDNVFLGVSILAIVVGAGSLIAGIIGVGNIMWIIVKERTHEIGIRRAIGAKPRDIIVQILSEGMVLTAIAGLGGICFATLALWVTDKALFDPEKGSAGFTLQFSSAIAIMATFLVLGTLAGLIPAIKAMKIKPIEAINDK